MTFPKASDKPVELEKPPFLRGLRWKITLSFVFLFFCLIGVLGFAGAAIEYAFLRHSFERSAVSDSDTLFDLGFTEIENSLESDYKKLQKDSTELLPWLDPQNRNKEAIVLWLKHYDEKLKLHRKTDYASTYNFSDDSEFGAAAIDQASANDRDDKTARPALFQFVVFDEKAEVIATSDPVMSDHSKDKQFVEMMLRENSPGKREFDNREGLHLRIAFPILDSQDRIAGVLFFRDALPLSWAEVFPNSFFSLLKDQLVENLIFFTIMGFVFGTPFAWYLSKRLDKIAFAAQSWRTGDFSAKTNDRSSDELGILSRNLNEMADDLKENFELRQTIATAEERNRIARDLHDSVKQQVFGLAMQISTANALIEKNPGSAKNHLAESENLIEEIQTELVDMIHEFSLPVKERESFKEKIENLVKDWARQNSVGTMVAADENARVSLAVSQSFYRIAQEALANIARHSEATEVKVVISGNAEKIKMAISDNGCGFDIEKIEKGFGLKSMRERAESLPNGWLKIMSKDSAGTILEAGCDTEAGNASK